MSNVLVKDLSIAETIKQMKEQGLQPDMRLFGIDENYFESIDELLKYCRQNRLSTQYLVILDYYRHFGNFNDLIRKTSSESSIYYAAPNEHGVCWYSDELHHASSDWEFNHGTIKSLYKPFREHGIVFEDDIYEKEEEKNKELLEYCKKHNAFNRGKKDSDIKLSV